MKIKAWKDVVFLAPKMGAGCNKENSGRHRRPVRFALIRPIDDEYEKKRQALLQRMLP